MIEGGYGATQEERKEHDAEYGFSHDVWIYDVQTDSYEQATPLPFGVSGMELTKVGSAVVGIGGEDRMRGRSARVLYGYFETTKP